MRVLQWLDAHYTSPSENAGFVALGDFFLRKKGVKSSRVNELVVSGWVTITAEHRLSSRLSECAGDILLMLQNLTKEKSFYIFS